MPEPTSPGGNFRNVSPDMNPGVMEALKRAPGAAIVPGIAEATKGNHVGVYGKSVTNVGVYGESEQDLAGKFVGNVEVKGDIRLVNADCAEDFDIAETAIADPGTVMVLNESGALQPSRHAYDKRVAGVVSGAGEYKPGIVLDKRESDLPRKPVALLGKAFCKVDATQNSMEVGDLLTTSTIPGHAMKVIDSTKALGTIGGWTPMVGSFIWPVPSSRFGRF